MTTINRRRLLTLGAAAASASLTGCGIFKNVSDGNIIGVVTRLAPQGYIWSTWEGEMALGNMRAGRAGSGTSSTFDFHVDDPKVVKQLQEAMENITPIEVTYYETWGHNPFRRENSAVVTAVKDLSNKLILPSNPTLSRSETGPSNTGAPTPIDSGNGVTLRCYPAPLSPAPK